MKEMKCLWKALCILQWGSEDGFPGNPPKFKAQLTAELLDLLQPYKDDTQQLHKALELSQQLFDNDNMTDREVAHAAVDSEIAKELNEETLSRLRKAVLLVRQESATWGLPNTRDRMAMVDAGGPDGIDESEGDDVG